MTLTTWLIIFIVVGTLVLDAVIYYVLGIKATISQTLYRLSQKYVVIPFAIGFAMGHIFWSNC